MAAVVQDRAGPPETMRGVPAGGSRKDGATPRARGAAAADAACSESAASAIARNGLRNRAWPPRTTGNGVAGPERRTVSWRVYGGKKTNGGNDFEAQSLHA